MVDKLMEVLIGGSIFSPLKNKTSLREQDFTSNSVTMAVASEGSMKHYISRGLVISYFIILLIISAQFYVESMRKPEMPQRFKVTMIDNLSGMVLRTVSLNFVFV